MIMYQLIALICVVSETHGFTMPSSFRRINLEVRAVSSNDVLSSKDEADSMRAEIEEMRQEAVKRLEILNKQVQEHGDVAGTNESEIESTDDNKEPKGVQSEPEKTEPEPNPLLALSNEQAQEGAKQEQEHQSAIQKSRKRLELLDDTSWKITLNIGREPGTWMPNDWGESGERLLLNIAVEFSPEQLYEREEFLASMSSAKVLKVVDSQLTIGPSLTEGSRKIAVKNGGWRIAPGEGPVGTDLLRFYVEIEEDAQHRGCDVYCPKGRVYCTCGYFPMIQRRTTKDAIRQEQEALSKKYDMLNRENEEDTNMFSLKKVQRAKQLFDVRMDSQELGVRMNKARIREPEKDLLRLSRDGSIGLTKEGGICCKVPKGLAIEYHILGKFGVAALEKKQHGRDTEETKSLRL